MYSVKVIHVSLEIWGSIFCLIMTFCSMFLSEHLEPARQRLLLHMQASASLLLSMDALAWMFRGYPGEVGYYMVRISNFLVFFINAILTMIYHAYVCDCIFTEENGWTDEKKRPFRIKLIYAIGVVSVLMVVISQFTNLYYYFDADNFYHRNTGYIISLLIPMTEIVLDLSMLIQYRRQIQRQVLIALFSYVVLPALAMVALMFYYGISLINIAVTISVIYMFIMAIIEQSKEMTTREKEMYDLQTKMMVSQIGPHFIYNTLTTIKHLCKTDPKMAAETVDEFAVYLRGNIDSLTQKKKISFSQELNHAQNYLAIEQKRFGERIQVEYAITETGFLLPALTLQPIVENAVKHGLTKKEDGGTICISTKRYENGYEIRVVDDGVGFDEKKTQNDGRVHTGVDNVRSRIEAMCGGTLEIHGIPGEGTEVRIRIPFERENTKKERGNR